MADIDPESAVVGLIGHAVVLGVVLFIALPVRGLLDKGARMGWAWGKDKIRKETTVKANTELVEKT